MPSRGWSITRVASEIHQTVAALVEGQAVMDWAHRMQAARAARASIGLIPYLLLLGTAHLQDERGPINNRRRGSMRGGRRGGRGG